jgi:hypothetical protein
MGAGGFSSAGDGLVSILTFEGAVLRYWWKGRLGWCCEDVVGTGRFAHCSGSRQ